MISLSSHGSITRRLLGAVVVAGALLGVPLARAAPEEPAADPTRTSPVLTGTVVDAITGAPLAGARVAIHAGDGTQHEAISRADGTWSAPALPPGPTRVVVSADTYFFHERSLVLAAGERAQIASALEPLETKAIEIFVSGERPAPVASSYTRDEVRQIPGAFGDPFRAVETMPGVTPVTSGLPFFYVRGSPPGNVGYFLDGVRVPYLYHVGLGPSVVQPGLIGRVDLHAGGHPARFGRFAGGIVSAEAADPRSGTHGEGNLRVFDAGALVEGELAGGRGSFALGGRYSYTAAILSLVSSTDKLDFHDYQARIGYQLTRRDRIGVLAFGAYDLLGEEHAGLFTTTLGTELHRVDVRYDRKLDQGNLRAAVTLGYDRTSTAFLRNDNGLLVDRSIGVRVEGQRAAGDRVRVAAGADLTFDSYRTELSPFIDPDSPDVQQFDRMFPARTDRTAGGWLDLVLDLGRIELRPGVRADLYRSAGVTARSADPRLAVRAVITPRLELEATAGLAHQLPSFVLPLPGVAPAQLAGGLQRTVHTAAGAELGVAADTTARATLFYSRFARLTDALSTLAGDELGDPEERPDGHAFGAELTLERRLTRRLGGMIAYTISRSVRRDSDETFLAAFDRTHVVNAAVSWAITRGWRAGARLVFYTGSPEQPPGNTAMPAPRTTDPARNPGTLRLDLRVERRWSVRGRGWISVVAEVLNATASRDTLGRSASRDSSTNETGPIVLPSLGVEGGF